MEPLIILSNLGRVRALTFRAAGDDPQQQAHLSEIPGSRVELRPQSVTKVVTDQATFETDVGEAHDAADRGILAEGHSGV